jgi:hypothetical protein
MLKNPIMDCLNRTSPIAVCGEIVEYKTDRENNVFTLVYNQDKEYSVPTEVYLHKADAAIECSAEYELEKIEDTNSAYLRINGKPGINTLTVKF